MNKILFLDFDGVLNSRQWGEYFIRKEGKIFYGPEHFCPVAMSNLLHIYKKTRCRIVISSAWRHFHSLEILRGMLSVYGIQGEDVIDVTPTKFNGTRGQEIQTWLDTEKPDVYAIVDDNDDMLSDCHGDKFVQTNADHGLMWADAVRLINILGEHRNATTE